jgi:hypothetical protein
MRDNNCTNSIFYATPYPGTRLYSDAREKIIEKYEEEDVYIALLADATDFRVNLTKMPDEELIECRQMAMEGVEF